MHDEGGIWSGPYLPITLANLTIVAIAAYDGLALVAALPSIADDLGSVSLLPWVVTAFLATSAIAGIVAGPIIDAIGVRRTFRVTGLWFFATSALAAVAPTMETLIIIRALQGIGGGLVISVALAAVGLTYPNRLRPRAFAANSMVWGTLGFGGPVLTAGLLALGSWRLIFIVQLPVTALALAAGWNTLPSTRERAERLTIDSKGIGLIAVLVVSSLMAVSQVGDDWRVAAGGTILAAAAVTGYWRHSGRVEAPVVARQHIVRFPLKRIHLTSGLVLIAGLAADNYLPLYLQTTRGRSESFAAFSVLFLTVGWSGAAVITSRALDRFRAADVILFGTCLLLPSAALAGFGVANSWPVALLFGTFLLMGMSIGFVSTSGLTLLQSSSADTEMGRANSAHQFVRTLCITYGVAIGGAILLFVVGRETGNVEAVRDVLGGEDAVVDGATLAAVRDGLTWVLVFSCIVGLAAFAAALVLRRQTAVGTLVTDDASGGADAAHPSPPIGGVT